MRVVGMDIHRSFAQVAILENGHIVKEQRVDLVRYRLIAFAKTLCQDDDVVIEATGNSNAVERLLRPYVRHVAIANPRLVRAIAYARVKTDKIDARVLAELYASGFLPFGACAGFRRDMLLAQAVHVLGVFLRAETGASAYCLDLRGLAAFRG